LGATRTSERLIQKLLEKDENLSQSFTERIRSLFMSRRNITFMDSSREECKRMARDYQQIEVVCADATEEGVVEELGLARADLVVCCTESQTFNILIAQLSKHLGAKKSLAITLNDRFQGLSSQKAVDALVSVKNVMAAAVLQLVRKGQIRTIHDFYEDNVEIVELELASDSPAVGKKVMELALPRRSLMAYLLRNQELLVPKGQTLLEANDTVAFIVHKTSIPALEVQFGGLLGS